MNLNANPTPEELRELLRRCDDSAGHHVLWVSTAGEVELSRVPANGTPGGPPGDYPEVRLRFEPFLAGNEYVGPEAAADQEWVAELFDRLVREWSQVKGRQGVAQVGQF